MTSTPAARRDYRTHVEAIPEDQRWNEHRIILRLLDDIAQVEVLVDELVREDTLLAGDYAILRRLRDLLAGHEPRDDLRHRLLHLAGIYDRGHDDLGSTGAVLRALADGDSVEEALCLDLSDPVAHARWQEALP